MQVKKPKFAVMDLCIYTGPSRRVARIQQILPPRDWHDPLRPEYEIQLLTEKNPEAMIRAAETELEAI